MSIVKFAWVSTMGALFAAGVAWVGGVPEKTVQITEKGYVPASVEIVVGQKVVFQNATQKDHTVTSKPAGEPGQDKDAAAFDSGPIKPATSWEHTFTQAGTFPYSCKEDRSMAGTVVVKPAK